uniref:Secreted protein n=1 Tax=Paramormyrops kingsleyae TaxID=1676925 RepID=A0A3B3SF73_9TELE
MMSPAFFCVFIISAASALTVFRHPFRPQGSKCFDETGMFYSGREVHDGYYIYKNIYIFPPGYHPRFKSQVSGHHYVVADEEEAKSEDGAQKTAVDVPRGDSAPEVKK